MFQLGHIAGNTNVTNLGHHTFLYLAIIARGRGVSFQAPSVNAGVVLVQVEFFTKQQQNQTSHIWARPIMNNLLDWFISIRVQTTIGYSNREFLFRRQKGIRIEIGYNSQGRTG